MGPGHGRGARARCASGGWGGAPRRVADAGDRRSISLNEAIASWFWVFGMAMRWHDFGSCRFLGFRCRSSGTKNMFVLYGPGYDGTIVVEDLATAMADLHGLDEEDLVTMFENVGRERTSRVTADDYVDIFQQLIQDDDGMFEILKTTTSGDKLADHVAKVLPPLHP